MADNSIRNYLASHFRFSALDEESLEILARHGSEMQCAKGEFLFRQDDPAEKFYILLKGSVCIEIPALAGPALQVQKLDRDKVLGWSWLIPPFTWHFDAHATTDSRVLVFDGKRLLDECEDNPGFGYQLMKIFASLMSERLSAARLRMIESWFPAGWA